MLKSQKRIFSHKHDFFLLFNAIFFKIKLQESFGIGILVHTAQGQVLWHTKYKIRPLQKGLIEKKLIGAISELRP